MITADYEPFCGLLNNLGLVFDKPVTDSIRQAYWDSLRDLHFASITRAAMSHQKHGKFFPKPKELRPTDEKPDRVTSEKEQSRQTEAEKANKATWDEYLRIDPEEARLKLILAKAARIQATTGRHEIIWEEADKEAYAAQCALYALWKKRRDAKKAV